MQNAECTMGYRRERPVCRSPFLCRAGGTAPADQLRQLPISNRRTSCAPSCHCEARQGCGNPFFSVPSGAGNAKHCMENGLPRRFAPRNDGGVRRLVLLYCISIIQHNRRGQCRTPYKTRIFLKKGLHFPNIHARISNVNIKSIDRVVVFSAHARRESGTVRATQHGKQGFPPGAAA